MMNGNRCIAAALAQQLHLLSVRREFWRQSMNSLSRRSVLIGGSAITLGAPTIARAQTLAQGGEWPKGPIKIIVPFPPGGSTDPVARIIQAKLIESAGWNVLVDNKPGGTGV